MSHQKDMKPVDWTVVVITLAGRVRGRPVVISPWLAEGVGRETRARVATKKARNNILLSTFAKKPLTINDYCSTLICTCLRKRVSSHELP